MGEGDVTIPAGTNLTLFGSAYVAGSITMPESTVLKFIGLEPTLYVEKCASIDTTEIDVSEENLKTIVNSRQSVYIDLLIISSCGAGTINVKSNIAPSCRQARMSIMTDKTASDMYSVAVEYTGFYSACATWTIPVLGVIHAIVFAAAVAYVVFNNCAPKFK